MFNILRGRKQVCIWWKMPSLDWSNTIKEVLKNNWYFSRIFLFLFLSMFVINSAVLKFINVDNRFSEKISLKKNSISLRKFHSILKFIHSEHTGLENDKTYSSRLGCNLVLLKSAWNFSSKNARENGIICSIMWAKNFQNHTTSSS